MGLAVTILVFAIMIAGIMKKTDLRCLLLGECVLVLTYLTITGGSVMGEATTGNAAMDILAYIASYLASGIGSITWSILLVFAYVEMMNAVGATGMLAYFLKKPLSKIQNTYLLAAVIVVIGTLLRTVIAAGPAEAALMIGTFLPVLIACGCSLGTAAVAMAVYNLWCFGPADPTVLAAAKIMQIEVDPTQWFVRVQVPIVAATLIAVLVSYILSAWYFDKKEGVQSQKGKNDSDVRPEVPSVYALMPLFPLIIMLVFSPFLLRGITVNINTAVILSILIVLLLTVTVGRGRKTVTETLQIFFAAIGDNLKNLGLIILFATCFAECLNRVGGMAQISQFIMKMNMPPVLLVFAVCAFTAIITIIVGSFYGALSIGAPLAASITEAAAVFAKIFRTDQIDKMILRRHLRRPDLRIEEILVVVGSRQMLNRTELPDDFIQDTGCYRKNHINPSIPAPYGYCRGLCRGTVLT